MVRAGGSYRNQNRAVATQGLNSRKDPFFRVRLLVAVVQATARLDPGFDLLGEARFVVLGQQRVLTDVREVEADEVFLVALDALLGHRQPSWS